MKIKSGQHFLMIGDSVTDMGRIRPLQDGISEGFGDQLGKGYPHIVCGMLNAVYPERLIRVTNAGNSGNSIRALKERWQRDCLDPLPDWVSVLIGINDVWRQFDTPHKPFNHILPDEYEATYRELVEKTLPHLSGGMVLMTPYFIETNTSDAMRARMDEYGAIVKRVAAEYGTLFVDLQVEFNRILQFRHSGNIAWDRVHPNLIGATVIARALLNALEFDYLHIPEADNAPSQH